MPMTPQEELQRIERLRRELSENRDAVARVARLEERTMFIPAEERPHGYYVDKATLGYRIMVESFRATDQQLTPTQDARLGRVVSVIDGLNSDAERYPWRNDPASRTQASLNSYVQEKMSQLNSVGETFIGSGHETHFNVVRIKRYPDGTLTYTLYDSGHETRGVGVRVDENGERRTQVNAVEERIIRPGASIEALIQAEARKSIVNAMPENGDTRAYQEQRAIIASLTEPTPVRVEVQDAQRRGNCTTRGQRIMMQDILADDGLSARVHGFITENTPHEVFESLGQERENVRAGRVRIPMPELQASESWKPYNSSAFGPSLRFETGYDARVNDVTPQMRSFSDYMSTRGVDVKWGYRDGKAYAYVPQTDQASFNYLEQHIRAAQRAARVDAERTILTPEPTRLVLNNQTFEQVLVERISTPGAIEYLSTNKGPSPIFRGDERTLNFLE